MFRYPLLLADIGGTNCRVGCVEAPDSAPVAIGRFGTQETDSVEESIAAIARDTGAAPRTAILAVAGPVSGPRIAVTNAGRNIDAALLGGLLGLACVALVNDFEAQAAAVTRLGPDDLATIAAGRENPRGTKLAIGPGTGFGVGFVVRAGDAGAIMASEGGHAGLGPETARESAMWRHIERVAGRITIESVVSGEGLARIDRALASADGASSPARASAEVIRAAIAGGDARAGEAVALFLDLLARAAGDLALVGKATGGVYICGGMTPRLLPRLDAARFRAIFAGRAPMGPMLSDMPLHVVTAESPAFAGLAALADDRSPLRVADMGLWTA